MIKTRCGVSDSSDLCDKSGHDLHSKGGWGPPVGNGPLVWGGLVLVLEERQGRRMWECYKARERVSGGLGK